MKKGFTLIELMVIVAIIGILVSVVLTILTILNNAREKLQTQQKIEQCDAVCLKFKR